MPAFAHRIVILNRLVEPARRPRDGQRAVLQRIHCTQPARLEMRRHEERIRARVCQMRDLFRGAVPVGEPPPVPLARDEKLALIRRIALTQNHQPHIIREQPVEQRQQQIDPLLLRQPRDHRQHRPARLRLQPALRQERLPARPLARQRRRRKALRQQLVRRRIPDRVIRAVQDPHKLPRLLPHHPVEPAPLLGSQDFPRVALAHRRQRIGEKEASFEQIQPPVKLHAPRRKVIARQIRQPEMLRRKAALIREIVNRQHRLERQPPLPHQHRHKRRLPVVDMKHIRRGHDPPRQFHRRFRKENEPRRRVLVVAPLLAVKRRAIKVTIRPHQKNLHAIRRAQFPDFRAHRRPAHRHRDLHARIPRLLAQPPITRQHHTHLVPRRRQRRR